MVTREPVDTQVLVVGAGPAGLMLAAELRLSGADVTVLERLSDPTGESRGIGLTIRTMEIFDQRGLLPRFGTLETSTTGHFGGVPLDLGVLGAALPAARTVPQAATEAVLAQRAAELGADIRRGQVFADVETGADRVIVTLADGTTLTARYLVGCDGGRSAVRKAAGFDFPGTPATRELLLADVRGIEPTPRMIGEQLDGGVVMVARMPDGVHRIIVSEHGKPAHRRSAPPDYAEVADAWKRLTGDDIAAGTPVWVSAFGDATRLVTSYRSGRVLLAGDAAHVHLPAGGQGMNTGIQDAVNLGWKLGAVVRGSAPDSLLDTYHSERHKVGCALLANTAAQSLLMLGGDEAAPLRAVLTELVARPEVERHLAARVSGVDIHYDVGGGSHRLLGTRMPHVPLTRDGRSTSTAELLRAGRGVLLDLASDPHTARTASAWADRVDLVTATASGAGTALDGTAAVLLRPDGHVAWTAPGSQRDLPTALDRWFGPAR